MCIVVVGSVLLVVHAGGGGVGLCGGGEDFVIAIRQNWLVVRLVVHSFDTTIRYNGAAAAANARGWKIANGKMSVV